MCSPSSARPADAPGWCWSLGTTPGHAQRAELWVVDLDGRSALREVRVVKDHLRVEDDTDRDVLFLEAPDGLVDAVPADPLRDPAIDLVHRPGSEREPKSANAGSDASASPPTMPQDAADASPRSPRRRSPSARRTSAMSPRRRSRSETRFPARCTTAPSFSRHRQLPFDHPQQRLEERDVDDLAPPRPDRARAAPRARRGRPAARVVASPSEKPTCSGRPSGSPVRCTAPLIASPIRPKPGRSAAVDALSEARDAKDRRAAGCAPTARRGRAPSARASPAGSSRRGRRQRRRVQQDVPPGLLAEIERQRALVAPGDLPPQRHALVLWTERADSVAADRVLDLHDVGAQIAEQGGRERSRDHVPEIEDPQVAQGARVGQPGRRHRAP